MVYRSKVGPIVWVPVAVLIGGLFIFYIINHIWDALIVSTLIVGLAVYMIITTYYTITGMVLNIRCGFFYNTDIDISTIKSIVETSTVLSAPALSLDRIEIFYNRYDSVIISPPDKTAFIAALKSINNDIEITLKEKKISK